MQGRKGEILLSVRGGCVGTEEQRNRRTKKLRNRGTEEQRNRRTKKLRNRETEEQRNRRTKKLKNKRTNECLIAQFLSCPVS